MLFSPSNEAAVPIFEYSCDACHHQFETLVRTGDVPSCPKCSSQALTKQISLPAIKSESTHALALGAAKRRDAKKSDENARAQREYELHHND